MKFACSHTDGQARRGRLSFARGEVETPAFMPVGTYGTVKAMTPEEVAATGAQIILGNTFHLMLRPGTEIINQHGSLHDFMHWNGPILTDSGGFQVFSLDALRKITEEGVTFSSPVNGDRVFLGPEESMQVQRALGADIVMIFDECTPWPATPEEARVSMELSCAGRAAAARHTVTIRPHCLVSFRVACIQTCGLPRLRVCRKSALTVTPSAACQWVKRRQNVSVYSGLLLLPCPQLPRAT